MRWKTYREANKGWRLDYFVVSEDFMPYIVETSIHKEYLGSDHCPILLEIDVSGGTYN